MIARKRSPPIYFTTEPKTSFLENERHANNNSLFREGGPIAKSYPDPRNEVLAGYRGRGDCFIGMNTQLAIVRRLAWVRGRSSRNSGTEVAESCGGVA